MLFLKRFSMPLINSPVKTISTIDICHCKDLASVEKSRTSRWVDWKFLDILEDLKFVPGGRITSMGTGLKEQPTSIVSSADSAVKTKIAWKASWMNCVAKLWFWSQKVAMVSALMWWDLVVPRRRKVVEFSWCGWNYRNVGHAKFCHHGGKWFKKTENKGKKKSVKRLLRWWQCPSTIQTLWNSSSAKQTSGRLTKFNMSVLVSDEFMTAVEKNLPWNLEFPDYENAKEEYKNSGTVIFLLGKEKIFGEDLSTFWKNANELWDLIMKSTYNHNEPGILFHWYNQQTEQFVLHRTYQYDKPLRWQVLPVGGHVCLDPSTTQFVDTQNNTWDYKS